MRAAFAMTPGIQFQMFTPTQLEELESLVSIDTNASLTDFRAASDNDLANIHILLTGWGASHLDDEALSRMPSLTAVIHTAGTVKAHLSPAVWNRGILVTTAAEANAVPVAEFAIAMILLAGKNTFVVAHDDNDRTERVNLTTAYPGIGNYRSTVGIIGASRIGRRVLDLLNSFDLEVLVFDPFLSADDAVALGARLVDLPTLLGSSRVISLHAPYTPSTQGMVTASHLALIRDGATIINTARPGIIDDAALEAELVSGRLNGILDVTAPEPLPAGHVLRQLPNVFLTPHLAGAQGTELTRLGESALEEVRRVIAGVPAAHPVSLEQLASMA